jgi:hypothetical protein
MISKRPCCCTTSADPCNHITCALVCIVLPTLVALTLLNHGQILSESALCTQLTVSMETFGLAIIQTLLTDISPDGKVKAAMNEINAATRLRSAATQKAEADKIRIVKAAEADAEAKFLSGQGIARQRQVCTPEAAYSLQTSCFCPGVLSSK